jgi:Subtilase family/PA domain
MLSLYSIPPGTIAAVDNGRGVVGVCPGCNLHIVRVFGPDGKWAYSSNLIAAAMKCKAAEANIISMSLGGTGNSSSENTAFNTLLTVDNILIVAAAGNGNSTNFSFPASYDSVLSVAAVDDKRVVAGFSQKNSQVDISAPGVNVISTVPMGTGFVASVAASGSAYAANNMAGSGAGVLEAALFDCGQGLTVCTGASGLICLIQRGGAAFAIKVQNCHDGGGIGAILYNNAPGIFTGTLGAGWTITTSAVTVADTTGVALLGLQVGTTVTLSVTSFDYGTKSGTSMATPHVSGVAGLVWSHDAANTALDIRNALTSTAMDLGPVGRDDSYGFGNVRACDAAKALGATGLSCFRPTRCAAGADCNDGIYCNGEETCDVAIGFCRALSTPCSLTETCDENSRTCLTASLPDSPTDPPSSLPSFSPSSPPSSSPSFSPSSPSSYPSASLTALPTEKQTKSPSESPTESPSKSPTECVTDADCNDGIFCNGDELCDVANGGCQPGRGNPCDANSQTCDEETDTCKPLPLPCLDLGASCQDDTNCCSGRCAGFPGSRSCK